MQDDDLISLLVSRHGNAFRQLVSIYGDRVFNTALGLLQNEQDAEDATQEVFITVYEKIHRFRGESSLSTWIYRVTVRHCLDQLKQRQRLRYGGRWKRVFSRNKEQELPELPDFVHPGVELERKEDARILFAAIAKLPENQKIAFTLHKIENLSYAHVAEVMETTESSVDALIYRARQNLRKWLEDFYKNRGEI